MPPVRRALRLIISLLAVAAWLVATNHCVVARMTAEPMAKAPAQEECPMHRAPPKKQPEGAMQCCKLFPPASFAAVKNLVAAASHALGAQLFFALALFSPNESQLRLQPLELDTGPPFARSFVESVLQRSLLAHAPPSLA